jgi:undecaprenyl-diphosphatase
MDSGTLTLNLILHVGTLLAVVLYFWKDLLKAIDLRFIKLGIVSSVPTAIIGLVIKKVFDFDHVSLFVVAGFFALSGIAIFLAHRKMHGRIYAPFSLETLYSEITYKYAFFIGVAQGLAALPGLSRSGSTIAVAVLCSISGPSALFYSFAISIPAIAGAVLLELKDVQIAADQTANYVLGAFTAFVVGMFCLVIMKYLFSGKARLDFFSYYLWLLAGVLCFL